MNKKISTILSSIILAIALTSIVSAFGVSTPYWAIEPARPLVMAPGETAIVELNLQNMVDPDDVTVKANITEGSNIANLDKDTYLVKAGTHDTMAPLTIKISQDAIEGEKTRIHVDFKTVTSNQGGMITMGTGMGVSFDVIVTGEQANLSPLESIPWIPATIILVILALMVVITILIRRRHQIIDEQKRLTNFK